MNAKYKISDKMRAKMDQAANDIERDKDRLIDESLARKAELDALLEALQMLKRAREAAGLSLADVSKKSGIDPARLSKLENDPSANPTISTLARIAAAVGVRLSIQIEAA